MSVRGRRIVIREDKRTRFHAGDVVHIRPRVGECTFFDAETEVNLEHHGG